MANDSIMSKVSIDSNTNNKESIFFKLTDFLNSQKLIYPLIYKSETLSGIDWFKVKDKNSNINMFLEELQEKIQDQDTYIVKRWHYSKGQFWSLVNEEQLKKLIKKNNYLYEVLAPNKQKKVYFDIDAKSDVLEEVKCIILEYFSEANFQISGYRSEEKYSYHIVLSNYYLTKENVHYVKAFAKINKNLGFDPAVYGKYNCFKCINQSKPKKDAPIQAYIEGSEDLSKHLIQVNFDDDLMSIDDLDWSIIKKMIPETLHDKDAINLLNINPLDIKYEIDENFDLSNSSTLEKLNVIPNPPRGHDNMLEHDIIFRIMVWCKNNRLTFDQFWNWNKQKDASETREMRYRTRYELADRYNCHEGFINTLLLKFFPFLKEDKTRQRYRKLNKIEHTRIIEEDYLQGEHISTDIKYSYLDIRMGGNKTGAVIDFVKEYTKDIPKVKLADYLENRDKTIQYKSVLYLSPLQSLSRSAHGRFKQNGVEFGLYLDIKNKEVLKSYDKLFLCAQSLHKVSGKRYDLVIIDEIETIWSHFDNDAKTHGVNLTTNWEMLKRILKSSKKVIVLDALLSNKTMNVFKVIDPSASSEVLTLTKKQDPRYFLNYKENEIGKWLGNIINDLKEGKKIFIFMPYKHIYPTSKRHQLTSVNSLTDYICDEFGWERNVDVIPYTGEEKENKKKLHQIETVWANAKCIIGNTCISVGNNYSGEDFHQIYAYFSKWVNIRDFIQVLYRIRNPQDKKIKVIFERYSPPIERDKSRMAQIGCPAFKELSRGFRTEYLARSRDKLAVCSQRTNIINTSRKKNLDLIKDFKVDLCGKDYYIKWEDIPDITPDELKLMISNILNGFDSILDKLKAEKYQVKKQFTNEETAKHFFYKRAYLESFDELLYSQHLVHKIFEHNGIESFFEVEELSDLQRSTLKIPKEITNDDIREVVDLRNPIEKRDMNLIARIINCIMNGRVFHCEKENGVYQRIGEEKVYKYIFEEEFLDYMFLFKEDSVKYQIYKEELLYAKIENEDENEQ